ncbi:hypothetical protein [Pelotalea chapellei]|uniref:Lipoprotein n=1 Tax=Pelotalea chapellei TaxID=44671 RepID=A0ABS5U885_9BACT|nr:hypothetical protein [Pelotalea chapellei]MBT1071870.1 hypothetical protein [Pelotalea chapellei]
MRFLLCLLLLVSFGCASNHFNVPTQNFADRVKVLGIAPIMVDTDSDILIPQKEQLLSMITEMNRKYEQQFVRRIKSTGNFYTVALLDGDPAATFTTMLYRREKRDDATIQYNKYFWKNEELREYIRKNNVDAVMTIVVSGLNKTDTIYSNTLLNSQKGDYNYLIMTAQILDANGTILWEYPNFRGRILKFPPLASLQYPDFNEAEANLSDQANIKFKTIDGIKNHFNVKRKDYLLRATQESEAYAEQFDEMILRLDFDPHSASKASAPAAAKPVVEQSVAAQPTSGPGTSPAAAPVAAAPQPPARQPAPAVTSKSLAAEEIKPVSDEIVPASGSIN